MAGEAGGLAQWTGWAQQLSLFLQIQLSFSLSQGASFHSPVRSIMTQSSRPMESLGSPRFQWLHRLGGGLVGALAEDGPEVQPIHRLGLT